MESAPVTILSIKKLNTSIVNVVNLDFSFKSAWSDYRWPIQMMVFREYHGLPWGFPMQPALVPVKTHAHSHGHGFPRAQVMGFLKPMGYQNHMSLHCGFV